MTDTLDEEIDELYQKVNENKRNDTRSAEQKIQEFINHPLFMDHDPTEEEIENNPALQGLQAIKYDKTDPHEYAATMKNDGNIFFKKGQYQQANLAYTEALTQQHDDTTLKAVLLTNRATSQFHLGNNRSALIDASCALKVKPDHMKAIIRASMCCYDMEKYAEALSWCNRGLEIDVKQKNLLEMKKKALHQQKQKERDDRKLELKLKKDLELLQEKLDAIKLRGVQLEREGEPVDLNNVNEFRDAFPVTGSGPHSGKAFLDDHKVLHWPSYFGYPEFNQTDFIQDFCEDTRFEDHLEVMFSDEDPPEWDTKGEYRSQYLKIYVDTASKNSLLDIPCSTTLKTVLSDSRCVVRDGCTSFTIVSTKSEYFKKLLKASTIEPF